MNPYSAFVAEFQRLWQEGKSLPLGTFAAPVHESAPADAPFALFFAPHPDDECIIGGLALRLLREAGMKVINVAVTQGSKKERQAERLSELRNACQYLGFGLVTTAPGGLEKINPQTRQREADHWKKCVRIIADILISHRPRVIFFPHEHDWNSTHIGTHFLVMDALAALGLDFTCYLVETEFWGQMNQPNLMVEITARDLADLIAATSFHVGEVKRNPYHLLLPAWMMDNVRRGSELVLGQGGGAPDIPFAILHRLRRWSRGRVEEILPKGRLLPSSSSAAEVFS